MNHHLRRILEYAGQPTAPADVRQAVQEFLKKPPRSPAAKMRPKTSTVETRREAKRAETSKLRELVFARASISPDGNTRYEVPLCELCPKDSRHVATQLAHLVGGNGRRKQRQSIANTAASCWEHNRDWDRFPLQRLEMAERWSARTGFSVPLSVLAAHEMRDIERFSRALRPSVRRP